MSDGMICIGWVVGGFVYLWIAYHLSKKARDAGDMALAMFPVVLSMIGVVGGGFLLILEVLKWARNQ